MRILVTGGAGFIGSHTLRTLASQGHDTALFDDFNDFYDPAIKRANARDCGARGFEGDLRRPEDVDAAFAAFRPEAVIHLAARAGVRPSLEQPRLYIDTNITGTLNVLESMRRHGCPRIVFGSSSSVYGASTRIPFSEDDPLPQTISPYAATKVAGEHLCSVYSHLYGLRTVSLRFFTVYGPGQRPDLAIHKFATLLAGGRPIPQFGDGTTRRDYTYIDDIVHGILRALDYQGPACDVFNLGENRTVPLHELIDLLGKALGITPRIQQLPEQPGDVPLTSANIDKARRLLGYDPQTPIEEGLRRFAAWFLARRQAMTPCA